MGKTNARVTWSVRTHAGAWDDCNDEPCKHKECNLQAPISTRLINYKVKCNVHISWTQGMTMPDDPNHTAQSERKIAQWKKRGGL